MLKKIVVAGVLAVLAAPVLAGSAYDKAGFVTKVEDGRLWVFKEGSKELEQFEKTGEPSINVSRIGEGPEGMTLKAPSAEVLEAYLTAK
jgi:hypothetical protein